MPPRHRGRRGLPAERLLAAQRRQGPGRPRLVGQGQPGRLGSTAGVDANDPTWIKGLFFWGSALHFDGNDYVTIPDSNSLEPQQMTVSAWFRGSGTPGNNRYLVAKGSNLCQAASYGLYSRPQRGHGDPRRRARRRGLTRAPEAPTSVWDGKWHNAAGTWDGSTSPLFIDGKEVENGTVGTTPPEYGTPSGNTTIGAYGGRAIWH